MERDFKCYPRKPLDFYGKKAKTLGEGAYGEVYLTTGGAYGTPVAIKQSSKDRDDLNDINSTTIIEIALLTRLDHKFIPKIIDVHHDEKYYYIVQESPGRSVKSGTEMSNEEILDIIFCLSQVYTYLKHEGIVHCDLKSDNILVSKGTNFISAYLIDFGLARLFGPADFIVDEPETCFAGLFRPPELLLGISGFDFKAEMWVLGTLWLTLSLGRIPFDMEKHIPTTAGIVRKQGIPHLVNLPFLHYDDIGMVQAWAEILGPIKKEWPGSKYLPKGSSLMLTNPSNLKPKIHEMTKTYAKEEKDLLLRLLTWNPHRRISAKKLVKLLGVKPVEIPSKLDCLRKRTQRAKPSQNVDWKQRKTVIIWLQEVKNAEKIPDRAFFLGIHLFDLFIGEKRVIRGDIQGYGCLALKLGMLMFSLTWPLEEIIYYSGDIYTVEHLLFLQNEMISILCFDLFQATAFDYLALSLPNQDFLAAVAKLRVLVRTKLVKSKTLEELANLALNPTSEVSELIIRKWNTEDDDDVILSKAGYFPNEVKYMKKYAKP